MHFVTNVIQHYINKMVIHRNKIFSNEIERNDEKLLNTLLTTDDEVLCQTQEMIYKEHYIPCKKLQNIY
jgi:2-hydroxy-3-keto-5-methylthiopentenyl-1-phosphate phosphatase